MKNKNNESNNSINFNTKQKQPFLKIPHSNNNYNINNQEKKLSYKEQMKKILEEREALQNEINQLDEEKKSKKNSNQDPINHINILLEERFKNVYLQNNDYDKIKQKVKEDNEKFQNIIMDDFLLFRNRQKHYLEKLQDKYYVINRRKNNVNSLDENAELISEPLYLGENVKNIFAQLPQKRYNLVINSAGNTKNELINDVNSKFYKNKLCKGVIQCMGGGPSSKNFSPPERKFLEVNNVKMDRELFYDAKKEFNEKRYKEKLEKKCQENIIENEEKTVNVLNKLFDIKYNNYLKVINELENKNNENDNFKILSDIKDKITKDKLFGKLTHKQLNIFQKTNEEIKDIITGKNKDKENEIYNFYNEDKNNEYKEEYFNRLNEENNKFDEEFEKLNDEIKKMKKKYLNYKPNPTYKSKNKNNITKNKNNIKRNKSTSFAVNRKFYNDNPYHYKYNYNGASIPIKKVLKNDKEFEIF